MNLMDFLEKKSGGDLNKQIELLKKSFLENIERKITLTLQEANFYDEDIDEEIEGFYLKTDNKNIFYSFDKTLEIKIEKDGEFNYEDLLTLGIVHDIHMNITQVNIRKILESDLSKSSKDLEDWAYSFLRVIESGFFVCSFIDIVDSLENYIENNYDVLILGKSSNKANEEENEEENIEGNNKAIVEKNKEKYEEKNEEKNEEENEEIIENKPKENKTEEKTEGVQLSFFPSEDEKTQNKAKNKQSSNSKVSETKTIKQTSKSFKASTVTLEEVKEKRPHVFDDSWIEDYLSTFNLNEHNKYVELIKKYRKYRREKYKEKPEALLFVSDITTLYRGYDDVLRKSLAAVLVDTNLLLTGETSTGKTTLVETLSKLMNIPIFTVNGSRDLNIETLIGFKDLDEGNITVKNGGLIRAMELGGMLYIDEANLILPSVLGIAHGALDHRKKIYNELTGEIVEADKDFLVTASINDRYEDTVEMNKATKDRFVAIEMDYMTKEHLIKLLEEFAGFGFGELQKELLKTDVSTADIWRLTDIATALQEAVKSEQISPEVASIRNIIDLMKLTRILSFEEAIMMIVEKYDREERHNIVAALQEIDRINISVDDIIDGSIRREDGEKEAI